MDFDSTERAALKNYLEHYGVKGQKWGVRRFEDEKSSSRRTSTMRNIGTGITKGATAVSTPKFTSKKETVNNVGSSVTKNAASAFQPKFTNRNSNKNNNLVSSLVARGVANNTARSSANGAKSVSVIGSKASGFKGAINKSNDILNKRISEAKVERANKYIKKLLANSADTLYDTPRENAQRTISEKMSAAAGLGRSTDEEKAQAFVAEIADNMIKLLTTGEDDKVEDELDKLVKDAAKKFSPTPEEKKEKINEMLSKMPGRKK